MKKEDLFLFVLCFFLSVNVVAQTTVTIDGLKYQLNGTEAYVSGYVGSPTDVVIPATIDSDGLTFKVTKVKSSAFRNCTTITSVKALGENLLTISETDYYHEGAFTGCTSLVSIIFPYVQTIGSSAFSGCSKLQNVWLGYKLKQILGVSGSSGDYYSAFRDCKMLSSIIIPASCTEIGGMTFSGCNRLQTIIYLGTQTGQYGSNADIINVNNMLTWTENSFVYSGKSPTPTFTSNLPTEFQPTSNAAQGDLEKNVGTYKTTVPVTFKNGDIQFTAYIPYSYTVTPVTLTARVKNASRQYGDANPQFNSEYSGFVNSENSSVITNHGTYSTSATTKSDVGTYTIKQSGATAQNYVFKYEDGTLTVNKAPLTMTANDKSMTYGNSVPTLDANYEGLKNNETQPVWTTSPVFATTAKQTSNVGAYPITISNAVAKNYDVTINNGTLTVEKANLTVRANNSSRLYGEANPQFTLSYTGLKNNETVPQWESQPKVQSSATLQSPVGNYPITISDAVAVNYNLSTVNGTLTVNKAPLQITPKDVTRKYGENNPEFELSYIGLKNNEYAPEWTTSPIFSTQATKTSPVGDYSVQVTSAEARNYTLEKKVGKLTITKAPLTVGVNSYSRRYGAVNPQFDLYYTGLRNNETIPEWTSQPTISTTATQKSDVGDYAITATGGIMRNYEVTTINSGVLTITPASLTVKANNTSRLYFEENPEFTFSCTGFVGNDNSSVLTVKPQIRTAATKKSKVGFYAIEISNAQSKNYTLSYENGQLTISKRQLTVSTKNYTRAYGEENPSFELNYAGFVNNENESTLITKPKATTNATTSSDVGSYNINIGNGVAENYEFTYVGGKLTIEKAYQTLTWNQDFSNVNQYDQIELTANASSGLGITYTVEGSPVCSIFKIGNKQYLDCNSGGEAVIVAIQEGNKNYWQTTKMYKPIVIKSATGDIKYNLTYIIDGKTYKIVKLGNGAVITPEASPTKEGYTFSGWSSIPQTMPAYDVTVTGSFTINKYKLTYMLDNNIYKEVWYNYGAAIVMEPAPQGNYASFEWVDLLTTMPAHDVVVNARYTISDNPNMIDGHEYVDLGLPSGLLWATMNVGAKKPEDPGLFFAWGETTPKSEYSWENYKYGQGSWDFKKITKYCNSSEYGVIDNKMVLEENDDAATTNWGKIWRTPTYSEAQELIDCCTWTSDWIVDGLLRRGFYVKGPNGNSIYIPIGGYMDEDFSIGYDIYCIMTASVGFYSSETACIMNNTGDKYRYWYRFYGYNVRPVKSKKANQINEAFNNEVDSIKAIYDIRGNKRENLQKGVNIVVYNNGKSRKIIK